MNRTSRSVVRPGSPDLHQIEDEKAQLQRGMKQFKTIEQQEQRQGEVPEGLRLSPSEERAMSPDEELLLAEEELEAAAESPGASSGPVRESKKTRQTKKATMQRASRMARPAEPTNNVLHRAEVMIKEKQQELERRGGTRLVAEDLSRSFRPPTGSGGKGPAVPSTADEASQATVNHVASLHARNIDSGSRDPTWLIGYGASVPSMYSRLAVNGVRSNSVNSSVVNKARTEGANIQHGRVYSSGISQAAGPQATKVSEILAVAESMSVPRDGAFAFAQPMATQSVNPAWLWQHTADAASRLLPLTTTSRLLFNANPTKLTSACILHVARGLAQAELDNYAISERMGTVSIMLTTLCNAIVRPQDYSIDNVWSSWVLISYLCCHPSGRALLRTTSLTDVDYQTAATFEAYGRAEVTKRARLENKQEEDDPKPKKAKKKKDASSSLEQEVERETARKKKMLAQKRKRGSKGCVSASSSDSHGLLSWWFHALRCSYNHVLHTLMAGSKKRAREAAEETLRYQALQKVEVSENLVIKDISYQNAVKSAQALATSFVGRRDAEAPTVVAWKDHTDAIKMGVVRTEHESRTTTLHACELAPTSVQPKGTGLSIAWSLASLRFAPRKDGLIPGIAEKIAEAARLERLGDKKSKQLSERMMAMVQGDADAARTTDASGITRSILSFETRVRLTPAQTEIASNLAQEMQEVAAAAKEVKVSSGLAEELSSSNGKGERTREPLVTPSSAFGLGLVLNEELRTWPAGKTRKNNPCRVLLGVSTAQERNRDSPVLMNSQPLPLAVMTDYRMGVGKQLADGSYQAGLGITICGDAAVRVPEMVETLRMEHTAYDFATQGLATLWVASSQASFISNVGSVISAGYANTAISSSKKISIPDNTILGLQSAYECYAASLANVETSLTGTPYQGATGCLIDTGIFSTGKYVSNVSNPRPTPLNRFHITQNQSTQLFWFWKL